MKRISIIVISVAFLLAGLLLVNSASAEQEQGVVTLWGKQTAGSGHMKNAVTDSSRLVLSKTATILSVEGNTPTFCIWKSVTPTNRTASSVLCSRPGVSIIGRTLPAGTYTLLPSVEGLSSSKVTVKLKEGL